MIAQVRSVYGSARSYPATTNTMLFPATSISCASSGIASIGSGGTFWFAAVKPRGRSGRSLLRSSKGGYHHPASCTLILNHALDRKRGNRLWRNVLVRRSQAARKKWEKFTPVFERWIPSPCVLHPYPEPRFYATHPS